MTAAISFRIETVTISAPLAEAFADLHAACFAQLPQETWSANTISTLLKSPGTMGLIALDPDDQAIGFIVGRAIADEGEIITLCVTPAARRKGVATALIGGLKEMLAPRRRLLLEVAITNRPARQLYEHLGFGEVGRRPAYYRRDGKTVDALVLASDAQR